MVLNKHIKLIKWKSINTHMTRKLKGIDILILNINQTLKLKWISLQPVINSMDGNNLLTLSHLKLEWSIPLTNLYLFKIEKINRRNDKMLNDKIFVTIFSFLQATFQEFIDWEDHKIALNYSSRTGMSTCQQFFL